VTANRVLHFMRKTQPGAQKLFSISSEGSQLLYINYCWNFNSVIDWNILQGGRDGHKTSDSGQLRKPIRFRADSSVGRILQVLWFISQSSNTCKTEVNFK